MYETTIDKLPREGILSGAFNPQIFWNNIVAGSIVNRQGGIITSRILRQDETHSGVPEPHLNDHYKTESVLFSGSVAVVKMIGGLRPSPFNYKPADFLVNALEDCKKERLRIENSGRNRI